MSLPSLVVGGDDHEYVDFVKKNKMVFLVVGAVVLVLVILLVVVLLMRDDEGMDNYLQKDLGDYLQSGMGWVTSGARVNVDGVRRSEAQYDHNDCGVDGGGYKCGYGEPEVDEFNNTYQLPTMNSADIWRANAANDVDANAINARAVQMKAAADGQTETMSSGYAGDRSGEDSLAMLLGPYPR